VKGNEGITLRVRRGVQVKVEEVDDVEGGGDARVRSDRDISITLPADLKVAVRRVSGVDTGQAGAVTTMCG
jgi:hypothetical protein